MKTSPDTTSPTGQETPASSWEKRRQNHWDNMEQISPAWRIVIGALWAFPVLGATTGAIDQPTWATFGFGIISAVWFIKAYTLHRTNQATRT